MSKKSMSCEKSTNQNACIDLTFLDYDAALESGGRTAEMKLQEKQREIEQLRELDAMSRDAIRELSERLMQLEARFDKNQKQAIIDLPSE
jgi:hypothetical protein